MLTFNKRFAQFTLRCDGVGWLGSVVEMARSTFNIQVKWTKVRTPGPVSFSPDRLSAQFRASLPACLGGWVGRRIQQERVTERETAAAAAAAKWHGMAGHQKRLDHATADESNFWQIVSAATDERTKRNMREKWGLLQCG
jgi:hypothetical protein